MLDELRRGGLREEGGPALRLASRCPKKTPREVALGFGGAFWAFSAKEGRCLKLGLLVHPFVLPQIATG